MTGWVRMRDSLWRQEWSQGALTRSNTLPSSRSKRRPSHPVLIQLTTQERRRQRYRGRLVQLVLAFENH